MRTGEGYNETNRALHKLDRNHHMDPPSTRLEFPDCENGQTGSAQESQETHRE